MLLCEQPTLSAALRTLHRNAMRSRSNLRSLAYKQACSLVSLDYVASGSTGRAKIAPRGAKTKKRQPRGSLFFVGGASSTKVEPNFI